MYYSESLMLKSRLFTGFSDNDCRDVLNALKPSSRSFMKNEILINAGDTVNYISLVKSGRIAGITLDHEGRSHMHYLLEPGTVLGLDIATTMSRVSPIVCMSLEACEVLSFSYDNLTQGSLITEPNRLKLYSNIVAILASENVKRIYKANLLCQKSLRKRILMYLKYVSSKSGSQTFTIPFNRVQLAEFLNVNRSALSAELSTMQADGLIDYRKNKFTLFI